MSIAWLYDHKMFVGVKDILWSLSSMSDEERVHFKIALPISLKQRLEHSSIENRRSLSAEMIHRLQDSLTLDVSGHWAEASDINRFEQADSTEAVRDLAGHLAAHLLYFRSSPGPATRDDLKIYLSNILHQYRVPIGRDSAGEGSSESVVMTKDEFMNMVREVAELTESGGLRTPGREARLADAAKADEERRAKKRATKLD